MVRLPLSCHSVHVHPGHRFRSVSRRHRRPSERRSAPLLPLRHHRHHQHRADKEAGRASGEAAQLELPAASASFTSALRQHVHETVQCLQMLRVRQ